MAHLMLVMRFLFKLQKKKMQFMVFWSQVYGYSLEYGILCLEIFGKLYILRVEKYEQWVLLIYDIHMINVTY